MARRDYDYGFNHLCPWSLESFTYIGACSHNPLKEAVLGDIVLSGEELQKIADDTREKNRAYLQDYHAKQRQEAAPEFKAAQAKANKKHRPKTKRIRQEAAKKKLFWCDVCEHAYQDQGHLTEHYASDKHQMNVIKAGGVPDMKIVKKVKRHHCIVCDKSFTYASGLKNHEKGGPHKRKAAAALRKAAAALRKAAA
jgi:hypothetical protein